jgi:hypothetical protein
LNDAWKRDRKQDACYEILKRLPPVTKASLRVCRLTKENSDPNTLALAQQSFLDAFGDFLNAQTTVEIVGSEQLRRAAALVGDIMKTMNIQAVAGQEELVRISIELIVSTTEDLKNACRVELGF